MKPTRRTQPYKKGNVGRGSGSLALSAAVRGATATGYNPQDAKRAAQKGSSTGGTAAPGLKGAVRQASASLGSPKTAPAGQRPATKARKPSNERVRAPKAAKRVLRDGLTPRIYAEGSRTNTSSDSPRAGKEFRTFTVGGKEFHEYSDPKTGKKVVVAGGKKSSARKVM